ncbi:MAG: LacI family DNA-binding transcriptional regulator [Pyrinomonadaceae bacterium]
MAHGAEDTSGKNMRIKDIARVAGVSTATVSHVINNTRFVSAEIRSRVEGVIKHFNYYPNGHARSLASGRSMTLGLVVSDIANPFFPELVKSIEDAAFVRGYDVVLANTSYDATRTSSYVRRFIERKTAGVMLMTSELDANLVDELARKEVSVVFLDLGSVGKHRSNISVDYTHGIEQAVAHLVAAGHQEFAFVGGTSHLRSAAQRLTAFQNSLAAHLPDARPLICEGNFQIESGIKAAGKILAQKIRPTAVIAANDIMALGVMQRCHAAGLRIPQDISIMGFDDIAFAALAEPPLTTVRLSRAELGVRAVEALLMTIDDPDSSGVEISITTQFVERKSTGKVPSFGHLR